MLAYLNYSDKELIAIARHGEINPELLETMIDRLETYTQLSSYIEELWEQILAMTELKAPIRLLVDTGDEGLNDAN